jgi:hypothetical protein
MITKDELQQLLADTESFHVERTVSKTDTDKFFKLSVPSPTTPNSRKTAI